MQKVYFVDNFNRSTWCAAFVCTGTKASAHERRHADEGRDADER
jgi:hypothetical protein